MQLIDKTVDCQGSHVVNEHAYHEVILQRRWMALSWLFAVVIFLYKFITCSVICMYNFFGFIARILIQAKKI